MSAPLNESVAIGVPLEAPGHAVWDESGMKDKPLANKVRAAQEWRDAQSRQREAARERTREAEADALCAALVEEMRRTPISAMAGRLLVVRGPHALYEEGHMGVWHPRDDLKRELNARLEQEHGVRVAHVTAARRRRLVHRACACGCGADDTDDGCPGECCCCVVCSALGACLPLVYWLPRLMGEFDLDDWEVGVEVRPQ